jgi:5'-3' exonuclease
MADVEWVDAQEELITKTTDVLIDGDVIVYGALPNRWGSVYDGPEKQFTPEEDKKYLLDGLLNLDTIIRQLSETLFADTVKIAIKGKDNFRYKVWPTYKQHRVKAVRPIKVFVDLLTECIIERHKAVPAHGMESDDLLCMWHRESTLAGRHPVIVSIDKDLLCLPGTHYRLSKGTCFGPETRDITRLVEIPEFNSKYFYYKQLLMGDPTDGIPGLAGIGPKRATAILEGCKTEAELQYMVIYSYKQLIGEKWKEALIVTGKLITLLPYPDYEFNIEGWNGS